jgi:hypothetical protein
MSTGEEEANFELICRLIDQIQDRLAHLEFASLTESEQTLWIVWWLEAEVNNGGFDQYFFNDAGNLARAAAQALRRIGAAQCAEIVADAVAIFSPPGPALDRGERHLQLESLSRQQKDRLEALTDRFYERPDPLENLLADFARASPTEFPVLDPSQTAQGFEYDAVEDALASAIDAELKTLALGWPDRVKRLARELEARRLARGCVDRVATLDPKRYRDA